MGAELGIEVHDVALSEANLAFSYTVKNSGDERIFLTNRFPSYGEQPAAELSPRVYSELRPNGLLLLSQKAFRVPEGVDVECPEAPYLTALLPHSKYSAKISVDVPVRYRHPYLRQDPTPQRSLATSVAFELGCVANASPDFIESMDDTEEWFLEYDDLLKFQALLTSESVALPVSTAITVPDDSAG